MEMILAVWRFEVQVAPVLLTILLFESVAIIRKLKKLYYVPIYFSVFPLREINQDLSKFLADDYFIGEGERLTDRELELVRKKIIFVSVISMFVSSILTPLFVGFLAAFYSTREIFVESVAVLLIFKTITLLFSIRNFHYHAVASRRNVAILASIYFLYIGVIYQMLLFSFEWAIPFVEGERWSELLSELGNLFFGKVVAQGIILALVVGVFTNLVADREVRIKNLDEDEN